ncbi:hypothetical protein N9X61_02835 [Sulfurimonas sp.]|nr:hypothetical protein [Sulfurimonas sp.]
MSKFYLFLWLSWATRVTITSIFSSVFFSSLIALFIYIKQGAVTLNSEVIEALIQIILFWFPLIWSVTLLLALFRSLKYIFNVCINGYTLKLLECNRTGVIEVIGYGDLVKVWRRWFMLMIWLSGAQMIISFGFIYIFSMYDSLFEWFNIYILFLFILMSGYLSFILLGGRCKKVKVQKC